MTLHDGRKHPDVRIKRAYEPIDASDGYRVLVDRLWPRGMSRTEVLFDEWSKQLAPSTSLRTWFGHKVSHWDEFCRRYRLELQAPEQRQHMHHLVESAKGKPITLVYAAKDIEHNHARVLATEIMGLY
ncbi:DUF488 domain-containing protein [Pollutimonas nitritireducens]|uniref:DUF488 domain-containing protein n=1 Tax=Pollutimonas nitritireducens TaxID=2045209 RepID=UPI001E44EF70|nr:DUF488 family protein [Pollutimonas nitritireducens]